MFNEMIALIVATANPGIRRGGSRFRCAFSPSGSEAALSALFLASVK